METKSTKGNKIAEAEQAQEFHWCWNANVDPIDENIDPDWCAYDNPTNKQIEENYLKGIHFMEIGVGAHVYCIDLKQKFQYLKKDPNRCRQIYRAHKKEYLRFIKIKESENYSASALNKNKAKNEPPKCYAKLKVCELFGYPEDNEGFIWDSSSNALFDTEIIISTNIHKALKKHFYYEVNFNNIEEVASYLQNEISLEEQKFELCNGAKKQIINTLELIKIPNFVKTPDDYMQKLKLKEKQNLKNLALEEKLVFLYSLDGYIKLSLDSVLRDFLFFSSQLFLFYTLLQASINILAKKFNSVYAANAIQKIKGEDFFVFYRAMQIPENFLLAEMKLLKQQKNSRLIYNDFLIASYDRNVVSELLLSGEIGAESKEDHVQVLYVYCIKKTDVEQRPGLFCFIEEVSSRPNRKEVLISSSNIFRTMKVQKKHEAGSQYEIVLEFDSDVYY